MVGIQTQVTVRDGTGYITGAPPEVQKALADATSYRPEGYQFSAAFNTWVGTGDSRRRKWDGKIKLIKNSKFPAGLLERVCGVLDGHDVSYELDVESTTEPAPVAMEAVGIDSRDYQDDAVEASLLNRRGVLQAPTGAGKTAIGARIIQVHGSRALVIVPTIDLLHQYRSFLSEHLRVEGGIGQLGDGVVDPREVTVATVRTAAKAMHVAYETYEFAEYDDKDDTEVKPQDLREWIDGIGTLIVDEAHILGAQVVYDVTTKLKCPRKYGMSASPWRDDGADLMIEGAVGPTINRIPVKKLVDEGWLVPPIIRNISTEGWWKPAAWGKNQFAKCYTAEISENPARNERIADIVNELEFPTLVLVKHVKHGKLLQPLIDDSIFLSGRDSGERRQEVYQQLKDGKLRVIIATTIADLGLDLPICQGLVLAGGGKSSTRHLQRIGRVARPYPGKRSALVIDFDDSHVHDWFKRHNAARRKIEKAEWGESALWI